MESGGISVTTDVAPQTQSCIKSKDPSGRSIINGFMMLDTLGEGSSGQVKLCQDIKTGKHFAIKIFNKTILRKRKEYHRRKDGAGMIYKDALMNVMKEIEIMRSLHSHPNIVSLQSVIDNETTDKLYIVMDFAQFGEVMQWDVPS